MFEHDDDHYDDGLDPEPSVDATNDDEDWRQPVPSWRNRLTDAEDVAGNALNPDRGQRRGTSIISEGTSFKGTLRSEDPLYIEGEFEGEIIASGDVTIARGAHVDARIQAIRLTVAGQLEGAAACTDRFEAVDSGVVAAEVLSPVFIVHEGATINGTLKMRLDDDSVPDEDNGNAETGEPNDS